VTAATDREDVWAEIPHGSSESAGINRNRYIRIVINQRL